MQEFATFQLLRELYFRDIAARKPEDKASSWCHSCSTLCQAILKQFSGNSDSGVKNFNRWATTSIADFPQSGIGCKDCYLVTRCCPPKQMRKNPKNNRYVRIPFQLGWSPPDWAIGALMQSLITSAAGSDGFEVFVAMNTLAFARETQPECMRLAVGPGVDGKSMIFSDLLGAVWGNAVGNCPGSMLQVEREFQQQGHALIDCAWMTFDEANREIGTQEAAMKTFVGNVIMPFRRNQEAEPHYASYENAGKAWCMNQGDTPCIPTAEEVSHARRYRCIFHRAEFTVDSDRWTSVCPFSMPSRNSRRSREANSPRARSFRS